MQIALDPHMLRQVLLAELPAMVAELGYEFIELSPRPDFLPFFVHPRANRQAIADFRKALDAAGVKIASVLPCTAGRARTRTSARRPCATGSVRSRSRSSWARR